MNKRWGFSQSNQLISYLSKLPIYWVCKKPKEYRIKWLFRMAQGLVNTILRLARKSVCINTILEKIHNWPLMRLVLTSSVSWISIISTILSLIFRSKCRKTKESFIHFTNHCFTWLSRSKTSFCFLWNPSPWSHSYLTTSTPLNCTHITPVLPINHI